ncbi:BLUF domain-containing protein [Sphingomonas sp. LY160]|uniref:BLUF domain-containing protein n=1 Tax=Sphingomonas sp. LY160 TaxID=3095342 RepID=UPI002ADEFAF0|nr:BLUF domain-containing protein [Sphingomonas sp. LY160]MEA1072212.1 BLUF domain-containing protein [Sphingomonas sp. LY160]
MIQLVYISTMRRPMTATDLSDILAASRANNRRDGITGLLVAGSNRFLQLLEGPAVDVRAAFDRIRRDDRHFATVVLSDRAVGERQCPHWAMGHLPAGSASADGDLRTVVESLVAPIADRDLRAQFTGFAEVQTTAA